MQRRCQARMNDKFVRQNGVSVRFVVIWDMGNGIRKELKHTGTSSCPGHPVLKERPNTIAEVLYTIYNNRSEKSREILSSWQLVVRSCCEGYLLRANLTIIQHY